MEIKFKKTKAEPENPFHTVNNYYKKPTSVHDQLMNCICWHSICGHKHYDLESPAQCDYSYCICPKFIQGEVEIWDEVREVEENSRKYEGGLF